MIAPIDALGDVGFMSDFEAGKLHAINIILLFVNDIQSTRDHQLTFTPPLKPKISTAKSLGFFLFSFVKTQFRQSRLNDNRPLEVCRGHVGFMSDSFFFITRALKLSTLKKTQGLPTYLNAAWGYCGKA